MWPICGSSRQTRSKRSGASQNTYAVSDTVTAEAIYVNLAGVFRFKFYADNQLEFIFDGGDDFRRYQEEWSKIFKSWTKEFCRHESFNRAVLELTVFYPEDYTPQMAGLRLSAFIAKFFDVKIDPQKGIVKKSVA